jgi:hypothetical protein
MRVSVFDRGTLQLRFQPQCKQRNPFGVASGTEIPAATRKGQKHLAPAFGVFATDASETMPQIPTIDEGIGYPGIELLQVLVHLILHLILLDRWQQPSYS